MSDGELGKTYENEEVIIRQGDVGDCLYVVQDGQVEFLAQREGTLARLRVAGKGEMFGEMAIFQHEVRSATVRALGKARVLTLDKRNFLRRINEDPSLAFRIVETMSRRVRELSEEVSRLNAALAERSSTS